MAGANATGPEAIRHTRLSTDWPRHTLNLQARRRSSTMRSLLLWALGVPIPIIILIALIH